jgi:hypothetical protein
LGRLRDLNDFVRFFVEAMARDSCYERYLRAQEE